MPQIISAQFPGAFSPEQLVSSWDLGGIEQGQQGLKTNLFLSLDFFGFIFFGTFWLH
jgi:hypothetical protein